MRARVRFGAMLAAALPVAALAAAPASKPGYQITVAPQYGSASYAPLGMMGWLDPSNTTVGPDGQVTPVSPASPLPAADVNSASYTDWPTLTPVAGVYTLPPGTRKLLVTSTAAGTLTLVSATGNPSTIPVPVGQVEINAVPASLTWTGTGTIQAWK